jgi:hypothetical protein
MATQKPKITLKEHINNIIYIVPDGVRVSFELRTSYDKVTGDYIVGQRAYYDETMLLRFSITKPKTPNTKKGE